MTWMPKREGELSFYTFNCYIPNGQKYTVDSVWQMQDKCVSDCKLVLVTHVIVFVFLLPLSGEGLWKKTKGWKEVWSRDEGNMKVEKRSAYYSEGISWLKVTLTIIDCWQTPSVPFYIKLVRKNRRWSNESLIRRTINRLVLIVWIASGEQVFFEKRNYIYLMLRCYPLIKVEFKWRLPLVHVQDLFISIQFIDVFYWT